jgi:hypothetical protein
MKRLLASAFPAPHSFPPKRQWILRVFVTFTAAGLHLNFTGFRFSCRHLTFFVLFFTARLYSYFIGYHLLSDVCHAHIIKKAQPQDRGWAQIILPVNAVFSTSIPGGFRALTRRRKLSAYIQLRVQFRVLTEFPAKVIKYIVSRQ